MMMRQPTAKVIVFFLGALAVGYALAIPIMTGMLQISINPTSLANLTAFAILFAVIMTIWLDQPLELELIKWPEKKAKIAKQRPVSQPEPTEQPVTAPQQPTMTSQSITPAQPLQISSEALFPHESPSEHWDVDFGDSQQVYQGTDLPVWILAGWAIFIIWAVVYLLSGLPTAF
jgi:hypothetical protein